MNVSTDITWTAAIIKRTADLRLAIMRLDQTALKILLVVDDSSRLIGTVTDGDIRRALLLGAALEAEIGGIMNISPTTVRDTTPASHVKDLMRVNKFHQIPALTADGVVVGLHLWDHYFSSRLHENLVVLMAGGFGKRMAPFTDDCPKPMLQVAGKPMIQHAIERARADGFHRFLLTLHYLPNVVRDYFGDGSKFGVEIEYVEECTPLGTAGALSLIPNQPELPFVVANGDILSQVRFSDLLAFHTDTNATATMAVRDHEINHPYGVVNTQDGTIAGFEEKPIWRTLINAGIYILNPSVLDHLIVNKFCDMPNLFDRIANASGKNVAYPMHETWMDVGNPQDLSHANQMFR